jgi:hypothetical protein
VVRWLTAEWISSPCCWIYWGLSTLYRYPFRLISHLVLFILFMILLCFFISIYYYLFIHFPLYCILLYFYVFYPFSPDILFSDSEVKLYTPPGEQVDKEVTCHFVSRDKKVHASFYYDWLCLDQPEKGTARWSTLNSITYFKASLRWTLQVVLQ